MEFSQMTAEEVAAYFEKEGTEPVEQTQGVLETINQAQQKAEELIVPPVQIQEEKPETLGLYEFFDQKLFKENILRPFESEDGSYEIPKSEEELIQLIEANKESWQDEVRQQQLDSLLQNTTPAYQFVAKHANQFKNVNDLVPLIQSVNEQDAIATLDPTKEEDQETIVRVGLKLQGLDDESINNEVNYLNSENKIEDRAKILKPIVEKYQERVTESILQEQIYKNQQENIFWNSYLDKLDKDFYSAKEVDGMSISKEHKALIANALLPNNEIGGLPIYNMIDELVGNGDFRKLAMITMIAQKEPLFDTYYGSRNNKAIATNLQKKLRDSVVANSTETPVDTNVNRSNTLGYGYYKQ